MILQRNFTCGQPKFYITSLYITQQWNNQVGCTRRPTQNFREFEYTAQTISAMNLRR
jgi:hypothetical protein